MARVRMTLERVAVSDDIDRAKVAETTGADIRRHMTEDGEDPDRPDEATSIVLPIAALRARVGLSLTEFAKALRIPPATLRNWEQGRTQLDPVAKSFFALVNDDPDRAFRILAK
jgi:putative transcriptional regulator